MSDEKSVKKFQKKTEESLKETLPQIREQLKNAQFGPCVGAISEHITLLDEIIEKLEEGGRLSKKDANSMLQTSKELVLGDTQIKKALSKLAVFKLFAQANSPKALVKTLRKHVRVIAPEIKRLWGSKPVKATFSILPNGMALWTAYTFYSVVGVAIDPLDPSTPPPPLFPDIFPDQPSPPGDGGFDAGFLYARYEWPWFVDAVVWGIILTLIGAALILRARKDEVHYRSKAAILRAREESYLEAFGTTMCFLGGLFIIAGTAGFVYSLTP